MSWKRRLYNNYVTSGQAFVAAENVTTEGAEQLLRPRAELIRHAIVSYLPMVREARVVDLGCGHGAFLYYLRKLGYTNTSGVDISPEQIDLAHKLGIVEARCRDLLSELEARDSESVDAFLMMDILEHLDEDELFETLDEMFRVLKKGGICLAHVPNAEGLYGMRVRYGDLTHERAYTPLSARQLFGSIGFRREMFRGPPGSPRVEEPRQTVALGRGNGSP